jgi:cytosine/adenosine deaminase-related metal-dependent hydrolase
MADLRIKSGIVVTLDGENSTVEADVYIQNGRISAIGGPEQPADRELDAAGMVLIPGMHDLHDHLRDLTPGLKAGEGLKLDDMLRFYWRLNEAAGEEEYQIMAAFGTARLLKAGITSVVDHIYPFHRPRLAEATVAGYNQSGIRWFMARGLMTKGYPPICETSADAFAAIRDLAGGLIPRERLFIAPVSFRQAEPDDYRTARQLADELNIGLYTHIAETAQEVETIQNQFGARPVKFLHQLGFTGKRSVFVHCVLLDEEEIQILLETGTHVVHCPVNHMKLAKGVTPVPRLLNAGVNVALGIDMQVDLFREVRQELLLQSVSNMNPSIISPTNAFKMACVNGARALGMGNDLGTLAPGMKADIVCVDLSSIHNQPVLDPLWNVIYRAEGSDVVHVVVEGEVVVCNRTLTKLDEAILVRETQSVIRSYLKRAGLEDQRVWS